jgi:hypothetical protein
MLRTTRRVAVTAICLVLASATEAQAQEGSAPNLQPVYHQMSGPSDKTVEAACPSATATPGTGWAELYRLAPLGESSFRPLAGDPLLDEPNFPPPGWYATVDVAAMTAHFKNRAFGAVPLGDGFTDVVHVPGASLDWTASPRVELGYRLWRGYGEFLLSYQSLVTEGSSNLAPNEGNAHLHSRLNINQVDLDYAHYHALAPGWDLRWRIGVQMTAAYYDTQSTQPFSLEAGASAVDEQRFANNFVGAGPHAGLEIWRQLDVVPGLAFYLNFNGSAPLGSLHQSFAETMATTGFAPTTLVGGASRNSLTQGLGIVGMEAGFSWTPPGSSATRFTLGYHLEQWYQLGRDEDTGSIGSLTEQGIFFRAQFNF